MKKVLISVVFVFGLLALTSGRSFADVVCQPIYGGGQNCQNLGTILVNKTVENKDTKSFVDNLGTNDPRFQGNDTVTFQISLTNTGGTTILQTAVKDVFPGFVSFQSGNGNFDNNTKALTFTVDNLLPNETRTFTIQGKVVDSKNLPDGITCVVNQVSATSNSGQMSQDNAQFCMEKPVTTTKGGLPIAPPAKVTTTPSTGPEALALFALLPGGAMGWLLRKKSQMLGGGEK